MTECTDLQHYLNGELAAPEQHQFEMHLADCATCASDVRAWQKIRQTIQQDAARRAFRTPAQDHVQRYRLEATFAGHRSLVPLKRNPILLFAAMALIACGLGALAIYWSHAVWDIGQNITASPSSVHITRFRADGRIFQSVENSENEISANANEQLLATVGADRIAVAPNGKITVHSRKQPANGLAVRDGWIACSVSKRSAHRRFVTQTWDNRFIVEVKGTRFGVNYRPPPTVPDSSPLFQVAVTEGVVAVKEQHLREWTLTAGKQLVVRADGTASVNAISNRHRTIVTSLLNPTSPAPDWTILLDEASAPSPEHSFGNGTAASSPAKKARRQGLRPVAPKAIAADTLSNFIVEMKQWIGTGRHGDAIRAIEERLITESTNSELWRLLAESRRKSGNYQGAAAAYRRVVEFASPQIANAARYKLGLMYQNELNQPANAIPFFASYLANESQLLRAEALYHLAKAEYSTGKKSLATVHLKEVIGAHGATAAAVKAKNC
jgi:TolA-binding protein